MQQNLGNVFIIRASFAIVLSGSYSETLPILKLLSCYEQWQHTQSDVIQHVIVQKLDELEWLQSSFLAYLIYLLGFTSSNDSSRYFQTYTFNASFQFVISTRCNWKLNLKIFIWYPTLLQSVDKLAFFYVMYDRCVILQCKLPRYTVVRKQPSAGSFLIPKINDLIEYDWLLTINLTIDVGFML